MKTAFIALHDGYKLESANKLLNTVCYVIYRQLKNVSFKFIVNAQTAKAWEAEAQKAEEARQSAGVKMNTPKPEAPEEEAPKA